MIKINKERAIIIGDIHGCVDELKSLLDKLNIDNTKDELYSVGDIVDRGPDPLGCFELLLQNNSKFIMGNHEDKMLRWIEHNERQNKLGIENPMRRVDQKTKNEYLSFSNEYIEKISKFEMYMKIGEYNGNDIIICHGGFEPAKKIKDQQYKKVIRARYVDKNGYMISVDNPIQVPPGGILWNESWPGPQSVIFGHNILSEDKPVIRKENNFFVASIDTGCVFGGHLTALILENNSNELKFEQIKSYKKYYNY